MNGTDILKHLIFSVTGKKNLRHYYIVNILQYINIEKLCCDAFVFRILWWTESSKEQHLFEIKVFCNILNDFTNTFEQLNAPLLNKAFN